MLKFTILLVKLLINIVRLFKLEFSITLYIEIVLRIKIVSISIEEKLTSTKY